MKRVLARGVVPVFAVLLMAGHPAPALCVPAETTFLADQEYQGALKQKIREAKRRVICAFYIFKTIGRSDSAPALIAADLADAATRGVEVTVILEGGDDVGRDNRAVAGYLTRKGVKVLFPRGKRITHAKAVVIDDHFVMIGSHNLSHTALTKNRELSLLIDSPELAAQVTRYLEGIR